MNLDGESNEVSYCVFITYETRFMQTYYIISNFIAISDTTYNWPAKPNNIEFSQFPYNV